MTGRRIQLRGSRHRGFTFVELMMGLVITSLVTTALAAVSYAVSTGWRSTEAIQAAQLAGNTTVVRLQDTIRKSRQTGLVRAGSLDGSSATAAGVMLWLGDANGDEHMQFSEIGLLQHDATARTITLYYVKFPSGWSQAQKNSHDWIASSADLNSTTAPEDFRALNYVTGRLIARNVTGAQFSVRNAGSTTARPVLEFILNLNRAGVAKTLYGVAALRGPGTPG